MENKDIIQGIQGIQESDFNKKEISLLTNQENASTLTVACNTSQESSGTTSQEKSKSIVDSDNNEACLVPNKEDDSATKPTVLDEYLKKLETALNTKLDKLPKNQRKALGYSMILVGVLLSLLLLANTFNKLDFNGVLIQQSSKEALSGLMSKASNLNSKIKQSQVETTEIDPLEEWQPITSLLASTEKRRKQASKNLGINQGEWILAAFSLTCGDCDRAAAKLTQLKLKNNLNVLAITTANQTDATLWRERLKLDFEVRSVSSEAFDDTGAVYLPTIIKLKDGISIGAKESLETNQSHN